MSNYNGDTPGKKIARLEFWKDRNINKLKESADKIVVLASEHGGDVSVLLGLDIPVKNIVAVDINKTSLNKFKNRYPQIKNTGKISKYIKKVSAGAACTMPVKQFKNLTECYIKRYCLNNINDDNLYLKLNMSKMQIAAYKAHKKMGTYGNISK